MDKRYGSQRWKRIRRQVLARDLWRRWALECGVSASVADHIEPVYDGMPDSLFFDPSNLRASCRRHNWARGVAARLERETGNTTAKRRRSACA